jgi:hypothetical protein
MNKTVLTVVGAVLAVAGVAGFVFPGFLGMHLSTVHNVIHLVSGFLALYFGLKGTIPAARTFSVFFGAIYALLGVIGFAVGGIHGMWVVIPNELVLGMVDHVIHFLVGGVLLFAALAKPALSPVHSHP